MTTKNVSMRIRSSSFLPLLSSNVWPCPFRGHCLHLVPSWPSFLLSFPYISVLRYCSGLLFYSEKGSRNTGIHLLTKLHGISRRQQSSRSLSRGSHISQLLCYLEKFYSLLQSSYSSGPAWTVFPFSIEVLNNYLTNQQLII